MNKTNVILIVTIFQVLASVATHDFNILLPDSP